ncbi:MAG TPA: hypothetical protein VFD19_02120 [Clostridia bacterium]|nr:hypothetical protein [Clostridia bacterium]
MAAKKKNTKTDRKLDTAKKAGKRRSKSDFTPPELRFWPRFFSSTTGRALTGIVIFGVLILFNILVCGRDSDRFFLMTGIEILVAMTVFWIALLYHRAARADEPRGR